MSRIIGLTGQTGAGKTVAAEFFAQNGFVVINCDIVAREVVKNGGNCLIELVAEFSPSILNADNSLNRKLLGSIVFSNREKLGRLNAIIFPYIKTSIEAKVAEIAASGAPLILLDAPTLFESGANVLCDCIVSIIAKSSLRLERIVKRDNLTEQEGKNRINSQHDDGFFKSNSDYIIENNESTKELLKRLEEVGGRIGKKKS